MGDPLHCTNYCTNGLTLSSHLYNYQEPLRHIIYQAGVIVDGGLGGGW